MLGWLIGCGATAAVFLVLDLIWLSSAGPAIYRPLLNDVLAPNPNYGAAALFYVIYVAAIMYLAVQPGVRAQSVLTAFVAGGVLGLAAYATYDLTNMATLKVWSLKVTILDIAWGTLLTAISAAAGCWAVMRTA